MIVQNLIKAALRKTGTLSSGETPEDARYATALEALQVMLRSWAQKRVLVFASKKESFSLIAGQSLYTWGAGGNITTTRPHQLLGAFVRDSGGTDHPVDIFSEGQYRNISSKATPGRPECLFYHPLYPLGAIYIYPVPQDPETMWLESMKDFLLENFYLLLETGGYLLTETGSRFLMEEVSMEVGDTLKFPPNYEEALVYNLAVRIAPEYGVQMSAEAIRVATDSYDALVILNSSAQIEPVDLRNEFPISIRGGYNINVG